MQKKFIFTYILRVLAISILSFTGTTPAMAQNKKIVKPVMDSIPFFRGFAVSIDMVGALQLAVSDYGQYEAALRVNLKDKYFPIIELGYGKADATDVTTNLGYKTSSPYARVGVDFNLMKNKHDIYRIYAGFRYAYTSYKFDVTSQHITDPVWKEPVDFQASDVKCNYSWMEAVTGIDAKIWGPVRLGWSLRYRCRIFHDDGTLGNTWYVPGYGKQGKTRLGGTFNVIIDF